MIQDSLISLFTDLIVAPMQADIIAKFATARAMADPMWGASMAFRVWSEAVTPEGMLHEVVPGYEPARS